MTTKTTLEQINEESCCEDCEAGLPCICPSEDSLENLEGEDPHAIDQYLRTGGPN